MGVKIKAAKFSDYITDVVNSLPFLPINSKKVVRLGILKLSILAINEYRRDPKMLDELNEIYDGYNQILK